MGRPCVVRQLPSPTGVLGRYLGAATKRVLRCVPTSSRSRGGGAPLSRTAATVLSAQTTPARLSAQRSVRAHCSGFRRIGSSCIAPTAPTVQLDGSRTLTQSTRVMATSGSDPALSCDASGRRVSAVNSAHGRDGFLRDDDDRMKLEQRLLRATLELHVRRQKAAAACPERRDVEGANSLGAGPRRQECALSGLTADQPGHRRGHLLSRCSGRQTRRVDCSQAGTVRRHCPAYGVAHAGRAPHRARPRKLRSESQEGARMSRSGAPLGVTSNPGPMAVAVVSPRPGFQALRRARGRTPPSASRSVPAPWFSCHAKRTGAARGPAAGTPTGVAEGEPLAARLRRLGRGSGCRRSTSHKGSPDGIIVSSGSPWRRTHAASLNKGVDVELMVEEPAPGLRPFVVREQLLVPGQQNHRLDAIDKTARFPQSREPIRRGPSP